MLKQISLLMFLRTSYCEGRISDCFCGRQSLNDDLLNVLSKPIANVSSLAMTDE